MEKKQKRVENRTISPRDARLIALIIENLQTEGKPKTNGQLMREAGFPLSTSRHPRPKIESKVIQDGIKPYLDQLDIKRKKALDFLSDKKLKDSTARDLTYINDVLTKNHRLLGGESTERIELSDAEKEQIDNLFD